MVAISHGRFTSVAAPQAPAPREELLDQRRRLALAERRAGSVRELDRRAPTVC